MFPPLQPDNSWTSGPEGSQHFLIRNLLKTRMHPGSWIQSSLGDLLTGFHYVSNRRIIKHTSTNCKVHWSQLVWAPQRLLQSSGCVSPYSSSRAMRVCLLMSEEGNLLHIPGFIIKVSSRLFSEIKNTYLEGKEYGSINIRFQATWHFFTYCSQSPRNELFQAILSAGTKKDKGTAN